MIIFMGVFFLITTSSSMFADTATDEQMRDAGVMPPAQDKCTHFVNNNNSLLGISTVYPSNFYSEPDNLIMMSFDDSEQF
ncbi:hypothetical protein [Pseudoalteromonas sp. NGC95]|uniref:hypothetical protein n=1 Tax=Pseudoalteromonas sp. NGC95 TaxID=2792051 RepID=UPI0018CEF45F|nr:hypothetical protein [Pseudoalteromonas sp. NGC95]MBH0017864.1 hypothetical protein [Pseudoalteromonas sp. NGC95]